MLYISFGSLMSSDKGISQMLLTFMCVKVIIYESKLFLLNYVCLLSNKIYSHYTFQFLINDIAIKKKKSIYVSKANYMMQ